MVLVMIVEDLVKTLQSMGVTSAYTEQDPDTRDKTADGKYSTVYGSPGTFMGKNHWRAILQTHTFGELFVGIAKDTAHTVTHWQG